MSLEQYSIFLVDDDVEDRAFFVEAIQEVSNNWKIREFANGVSLMAELLKKDIEYPKIIFLDLRMPMMDGFECLNDIKNNILLRNIPIAIYSNWCQQQELEYLKERGADFFLVKPSKFSELKNALERITSIVETSQIDSPNEFNLMDYS